MESLKNNKELFDQLFKKEESETTDSFYERKLIRLQEEYERQKQETTRNQAIKKNEKS